MQLVHMHPQVEKVVVGARTPDELQASLKYALEPLSPKFWEALKQEGLIPASTLIPSYECAPVMSIFAHADEKRKYRRKMKSKILDLRFRASGNW